MLAGAIIRSVLFCSDLLPCTHQPDGCCSSTVDRFEPRGHWLQVVKAYGLTLGFVAAKPMKLMRYLKRATQYKPWIPGVNGAIRTFFHLFFILLPFIWVSWKDSCRIALVTCHTRAGTLKQARISVVWARQSIHYITVTAWDSWTAALYYGRRGVTVRVAEVARIDARGNQTRDTLAKDRYRGRVDKIRHHLKL